MEAPPLSRLVRPLLIVVGIVSLALGVLGIFLPLLPTTPFVLLSAACFVRSSARLHRWLREHALLGRYLRDWEGGRGVPARAKAGTLAVLWATAPISGSTLYAAWGPTPRWYACVGVLLASAVGVTAWLLLRVPTRPADADGDVTRTT
ncbi:MAG: YbaN family protein [Myxococcota bacterium]